MDVLRNTLTLLPYVLLYVSLCGVPCPASAHGELDIRIQEVTDKIQEKPENDSLYIVRGTLYFQHEEYLKSIRDFEKAETLTGKSILIYLSYAKSWHQLQEYNFALENLEEALKIDDQNGVAYRLRANVYMDQGEYEKAAQDFEAVLQYSDKKITEYYTDYIRALDKIGTPSSNAKAIAVIDRGIKALGVLPLFLTSKVDHYTAAENFPAAIAIQTDLINLLNRKETHLYKRAQLFLMNDEPEKSRKDILTAYNEIDALPVRYAGSIQMKTLRTELEALLEN